MIERYRLYVCRDTAKAYQSWLSIDNIQNKPKCFGVGIKEEIHFWTIENNIKYSIEYDYISTKKWYLEFENIDDLLLFKLTWI